MNISDSLYKDSELWSLVALLKSATHWEVIKAANGKDGVARHLLWHSGGGGDCDFYFEVRKSGDLLLKTQDARLASEKFLDEVNRN